MAESEQTRTQKCVSARLKRLADCHVEFLSPTKCHSLGFHLVRLDLENGIEISPERFFLPLPLDLLERHPIRKVNLEASKRVHHNYLRVSDYDAKKVESLSPESDPHDLVAWTPGACLGQIFQVLEQMVFATRDNLKAPNARNFADILPWDQVE